MALKDISAQLTTVAQALTAAQATLGTAQAGIAALLVAPPAPPPPPPILPPAPPPPPTLSVAWNAPSSGAVLSGPALVAVTGAAIVNAEIWYGGVCVAALTTNAAGTRAIGSLDTTKLPNGSVSLLAYVWDAPAGKATTTTKNASASLSVIISNASPAPPVSPPPPPLPPAPATAPVTQHFAAMATAPAHPALAKVGLKLSLDLTFNSVSGTIKTLADLQAVCDPTFAGGVNTLSGNGEWERYSSWGNHAVTPGGLILSATAPGGLVNGGINSGMIKTKRGDMRYGYYECRMKVPPGAGMWPAFWNLASDGTWPPEIDFVEIVTDTKRSFHFLHSNKVGAAEPGYLADVDNAAYVPGFDYAADFHIFAALWTPTQILTYVDDVLVAVRDFSWVHDDGTDGGNCYLIVNLAVGGGWPGAPNNLADFPADLTVDYVRYWAQ